MKSNKFWIALLGGALAVSLAAVLIIRLVSNEGTAAYIYQDSYLLETIDLSAVEEPYDFVVEYGGGGSNVIEVEHGRIRISRADCPDGICVAQGFIENGAEMIVCLPHRLIIKIDKTAVDNADAIAG